MQGPRPQLKTNDLINEIVCLARPSAFFLNRDSISVAKLLRDIASIIKVDASVGWGLKGILESYCGDESRLDEAYRNFVRLPADEASIVNFSVAYARIGRFSRAQEILRPCVNAEDGELTANLFNALNVGLFQHVREQIQVARNLKLSIADTYDRDITTVIATQVLEAANISDSEVAEQLDALGSVLRAHNLRPRKQCLNAVNIAGICSSAVIQIEAAGLSDSEVFDLNVEASIEGERRGLRTLENFSTIFSSHI